LLLVGVALLAVAAFGFWRMRIARDQLHTMIGTTTSTIPELEELRRISDELGAKGGFRKTTEVVGAAHPRPAGVLTAELSKTPCVWYRYRVRRKYYYYRDGKRREKWETVAEHESGEGYALIDDEGRTIGVAPHGTSPEGAEKSVDSYRPESDGAAGFLGLRLPGFSSRRGTAGHKYEEWIIRPGTRMYILGEVHDIIGPLVIAKPQDGGHFIIAAKSEEELRADRRRRHRLFAIGVVVAFLAGLGLLGAGIFA